MKNALREIIEGKRIPLMGFVEPLLYGHRKRDDFVVTEEEAFAAVKESGLELLIGAQYRFDQDGETVERILKACERAGVLYIVLDPYGFEDRTEAEAEEYFRTAYAPLTKYESFAGISPADEPGYEAWDRLKKFSRAFYRVYPDKLYYVNLLQNYAPAWAISRGAGNRGGLAPDGDYDFYCKSYVKQAEPRQFCYDFYPFSEEYPHVKEGYFEQLETAYKYARQAKIPVWCFLQASGFPEMSGFRRLPVFEELLWQVNTSFCYGTTGLAYFYYWTPYDDENWTGGFTDVRGGKTETYETAKRLNAYARTLEPFLLGGEIRKIIRDGKAISYAPCPEVLDVTEGGIVSCIVRDGKKYAFVANGRFDEETRVEVRVDETVVAASDPIGGETVFPEKGRLTLSLGKGEAKMLVLKTEN